MDPQAAFPDGAARARQLTLVLERGEPVPADLVEPGVTVPVCRPDVRSHRRTRARSRRRTRCTGKRSR